MTNWVSNHLQIVGEPEKIAAVLAEFVIDTTMDNSIDFAGISGTTDRPSWARFTVVNYTPGSTYADIYYETPWSPAYKALKLMSGRHPDVHFICVCSDWLACWEAYFSLINGEDIRGHCEEIHNDYDGTPYQTTWYDHAIGEDGQPVLCDGSEA